MSMDKGLKDPKMTIDTLFIGGPWAGKRRTQDADSPPYLTVVEHPGVPAIGPTLDAIPMPVCVQKHHYVALKLTDNFQVMMCEVIGPIDADMVLKELFDGYHSIDL
jgi:hypothetical protein